MSTKSKIDHENRTEFQKSNYCNYYTRIPVVTYSFNVINWNMNELKRLDAKIMKQLTCNRMHHPKSDVERLYVARKKSGRGGMIQLELSYKTSTIAIVITMGSLNILIGLMTVCCK